MAAYLWQKLRRAGGQVDAEVDRVEDKLLDTLHDTVTRALGDDPALAALEREATDGEESKPAQRRVADAIADAADRDEDFAARLRDLVAELQRHRPTAGARSVTIGGEQTGIVSTGDNATNIQHR